MNSFDAFRIIYENEEMMVINKPFDVAMDGDHAVTVEKWVQVAQKDFMARPLPTGNLTQHGGSNGVGEKRLKFVHQLDYATSGVLCLAFSKDTAGRLAHCFQMRYTRKEYLAIVYGHVDTVSILTVNPNHGSSGPGMIESLKPTGEKEVDANSLLIDAPIGPDDSDESGFRMRIDPSTRGRSARTVVRVLERGYLNGFSSVAVSKVLLSPESGRRHQLRVHLSLIGHPIVGDASYASSSDLKQHMCDSVEAQGGVTIPHRMMLHAWRLRLSEDVTRVEVQSHRERVDAKKKRRRETLGLEVHDGDEAVAPGSGSLFETDDPFVGFVVSRKAQTSVD